MIKVIVMFKGTENIITFKTEARLSDVQNSIINARRRHEQDIRFSTPTGSVFFDPREVIGFAIDKI